MLATEMSHRIKNLLSLADAMTAIAARSAASTSDMARDLTQRLAALGRALDLVRPIPGQADRAATLNGMITVLLAPYRKVTGGFRSQWGADLFASVRSVVGTAARAGIDAYAAILNPLCGCQSPAPG